MKINQRWLSLSLGLALVLAPAVAAMQSQPTADEVIEKHLAAIGGRDVLSKLTSRRATGTVSVSTPAGDLSGPAELLSKAPNKVRVRIELDLTPMGLNQKLTVDQKFDGTTGWILDSMQGDRQVTGNQLENMRSNTFPSPLLNYKSAGTKVELEPREQIAGKSLIVLLVTPKAGSVIRLYFDPDTFLLVRSRATINTPEMGDIEQIVELSDYRTQDGMKIPFQSVNTNSAQTITIKLQKIEHNVPIDDAVFSVKTP